MSKKKNETPDTGFQSVENALSKTEQYIEENQKSLTIIITAILIIIAAYLGYKRFYLEPKENEALSEMFYAEKYFETDSFNLALSGDGSYLGFLDIIDEYGVTKSARLAHYYAGICYLRTGGFEDAITHLKKFDGNDVMVASIALGAIGDAYCELEDYKNAATYYTKAAKRKKNEFTSPIFLKKAATVYEELGDYRKALTLYKQIESEYPESEEGRDIEKNIVSAEMKLGK